jgi:alkanesulfonate monooxygenase SsuD/methylene tetrahydromethanopterin reductase-like flavin-dependent oxidoreductase (luciferase family)
MGSLTLSDFSLMPCNWGRQPATPQQIVDVTRHAEDLGFYSVGIPHVPILPHAEERIATGSQIWAHLPREYRDYQYDCLVLVPLMAQATTRIRIGFNVLVTPWVHPFVWAKYLASLDAFTGGRVIAGFGLGAASPEGAVKALDNFGIDGRQRGAMADEALELIVKLWTSAEPLSHDGTYFKAKDLIIEPKPAQKPYPEIWWAGHLQKSIVRAARYASYLELAAFTLPGHPVTTIKERYVPQLAEANRQFGRTAKVQALLYTNVLDADLPSEELSGAYWNWRGPVLESLAVGTPERCAAVIRAFRDAGSEHFVLDLHRHGLDPVTRLHEQMERFVKEVLPLLR